jgi:hypothetical protein
MVQPYMDSDWAIFAPVQLPLYPNANENKSKYTAKSFPYGFPMHIVF